MDCDPLLPVPVLVALPIRSFGGLGVPEHGLVALSMSRLYPAFLTIARHAPKQLEENRMAVSIGNYIGEAKKIVIAACGFIVALGAVPFFTTVVHVLPPSWSGFLSGVIALATLVLAYLAPAETTDPKRAVGRSVRVKGTKPLKTAKPAA